MRATISPGSGQRAPLRWRTVRSIDLCSGEGGSGATGKPQRHAAFARSAGGKERFLLTRQGRGVKARGVSGGEGMDVRPRSLDFRSNEKTALFAIRVEVSRLTGGFFMTTKAPVRSKCSIQQCDRGC